MPDYNETELSERNFFYSILSTLYEAETKEIIKKEREALSLKQTDDVGELVEINSAIMKEVERVFNMESKYLFHYYLISNERNIQLLPQKKS